MDEPGFDTIPDIYVKGNSKERIRFYKQDLEKT